MRSEFLTSPEPAQRGCGSRPDTLVLPATTAAVKPSLSKLGTQQTSGDAYTIPRIRPALRKEAEDLSDRRATVTRPCRPLGRRPLQERPALFCLVVVRYSVMVVDVVGASTDDPEFWKHSKRHWLSTAIRVRSCLPAASVVRTVARVRQRQRWRRRQGPGWQLHCVHGVASAHLGLA